MIFQVGRSLQGAVMPRWANQSQRRESALVLLVKAMHIDNVRGR